MLLSLAAAAVQEPASVAGGVPGFLESYALQFGIVGVVVLCLLFRKFIVPEWTLRQAEQQVAKLESENAALRSQNDRLQGVVEEKLIPALTLTTEGLAKYTDELAHRRWVASRGESRGDPGSPS